MHNEQPCGKREQSSGGLARRPQSRRHGDGPARSLARVWLFDGAYGAGMLVYTNLIARGRDLVFPKDAATPPPSPKTRIEPLAARKAYEILMLFGSITSFARN